MGKAPAPPNPATTAQAQTDSNRSTAITQFGLNATNQISPYGNLTYDQIGTWEDGTPRFQATQSLSPGGQQLFNTGQQTQQNLANLAQEQSGRLSGLLNQSLNFSGLPGAGQVPTGNRYGSGPSLTTQGGDTSGISNSFGNAGDIQMQLGGQDNWGRVQDVESALFQRGAAQRASDLEAFETNLANKGIRAGSTAYKSAWDIQNQKLNDENLAIRLGAGQEQNRLQQLDLNSGNFANNAQAQNFGQMFNRAQFGNQAQQQLYNQQIGNNAFANQASQQMYQNGFNATQANNALDQQAFANQNLSRQNSLNELLLQRNTPLQEIGFLMGQGQLPQPSFVSTPQSGVAGTDVAGITNANYGQQMNQWQQNQGLVGGLFSAGASLLPLLSDRRAKKNIKRVGTLDNGLPVYVYSYVHGGPPQIGLMADEVQEVHPEAVVRGPDGLDRVNYEQAVA